MKLTCTYCNKEFDHPTFRKTCSKQCQQKQSHKNTKIHYLGDRYCVICGKPLKSSDPKVTTCSRDCGYKKRSINQAKVQAKKKAFQPLKIEEVQKPKIHTCKHCLTILPKNNPYSPYCSSKCLREHFKILNKDKFLNCIICNKPYSPTPDKRQTCSKSCSEELKKRNNLEKHGVSNPMQHPVFRQNAVTTCLEKYQASNPFQVEEFKRKGRLTNLAKRGVEYACQKNVSKKALEFFKDTKKVHYEYEVLKKTVAMLCKELDTYPDYITEHLRKQGIELRIEHCTSETQKEISEFVESLGVEIEINNRNQLVSKRTNRSKEIDIFIPSLRIGIEFNGVYHHSEEFCDKNYHLDKTKLAESNNIHLIHIFSDDWLYKQEIVKRRLTQILGKANSKISARKCNVRELSSFETNTFLENYHIQGTVKSSVKLGLFFENKLVACMNFGKPRNHRETIIYAPDHYELLRFCSSENVVGGASKLFTYFVRNYNPSRVLSYADRHWTSSIKKNIYDTLGFIKTSDGQLNYWYVIDDHRKHRFEFRKSELKRKLQNFDSNLTEHQNMLNNGYYRIYGCGSLRYEWEKPTTSESSS